MNAPEPEQEGQRLAKLLSYKILDTQPETAYDDLVKLAAYICQTPIALVSLVDSKRQWFKAKVGLEISETPRDLAFCAHAILQPALFIVPDTKADVRFANHPLVIGEPYIRFYAGIPLHTADGLALGTLCVIDNQPRMLSDVQINALEALGRQVMSQLELRSSNQKLQQEIAEHQQAGAVHQQVAAHLQKEQECLKAMLDSLTDGIVACDDKGDLMLSNHATRTFHGLPEAALPADQWAQHFDLYLADGITPMPTHAIPLFRAFQGEQVHKAEMVIVPKHGTPRTLLASGRAFFDEAGNKLGAVVAMHDITERKHAAIEHQDMETALYQSESRFHNLAANLPGTVYQFRLDADGVGSFPYMSAFCKEFYEVEPEAVQQNAGVILERIHPDDRDSFFASIATSQQTLQPWDWVGRLLMPSGQVKWLHAISRPERQADGSTVWDGLQLDVSDRKQAEIALQQALQETEYQSRLLRTVLDSTQDWIFAKDHNFRYILVNRSFAKALGQDVEAIVGKDDLELGYPQELIFGLPEKNIRGFRVDDQAALAGERIHNHYDPATTADGSLRILDTRKTPLYDSDENVFAMLGYSRDITEQHYAEQALRHSEAQLKEKAEELEQTLRKLRHTQTQMIQAEKMSGLGQLVAGIAHEINNPVNFIHGNLNPAQEYTQDLLNLLRLYQAQVPNPGVEIEATIEMIDLDFLREDLPKLLSSMKMGTDRIREIVLSLRNFSRLDEAGRKAVNLHEGIDNTLIILGNRLKAQGKEPEINIAKQYGDLPLVECYAGQLNQVFMNLLSNAIDALREESEDQDRQAGNALAGTTPTITIRTQLINPQHVQICIADNGTGMTTDVQQKLFEPFFTTKAVGKGTGMGLAICYQIVVEKHEGTIEVSSTPDKGTEFCLTLPV
jgi:PAS domain S-box-containing protein